MNLIGLVGFNVLVGVSTIALITIGLGVIYGMMKIINLAHGEFVMLGAYATHVSVSHGISLWVAMLIVSPLVVGIVGLVVERCLIRFLYGRMMDTMLATWGLSLGLIGLTTAMFGNETRGVATPLGSFAIGQYSAILYGFVIVAVAIVSLTVLYIMLRFTRYGLVVRATMQNANMAAAVGVNPPTIYMGTFALGAALAGLAGGVLVPISGVSPVMGSAFIAKAFITVLGGGGSIVTGTSLASGIFGFINTIVSFESTPVIGEVALLLAAVLIIRILPQGITGRFLRRSL